MSQATAANATIKNTNRWSTRQLVTMALMCAIAALLSFVQIPILPAAPFLTYDPSLMPAMVCGFAFGPGAGFAVGAVKRQDVLPKPTTPGMVVFGLPSSGCHVAFSRGSHA